VKQLSEMTPDEVIAERNRRDDRRRKGLPLHDTPEEQAERIQEEDNRLEKEIQADVRKLYIAFGCVVYNLSQPRATKQSPGLADLYVVHRGSHQVWWHETKTPAGQQSLAQKYFQEIHTRTPVGYVVGGRLAAEEELIRRAIAIRESGVLETLR
jgi:hypothetical protein